LAGIPLLMVLMWAHWRPILLWMGGTTIAGLFLASTINAMTLGIFGTQAFGSIALVGHVAYMIQTDPTSRYPELSASIDPLVASARTEIESAHIPREHWMVSTELYNSLLWYRVLPEIGKYLKKTAAANKQGSNEWADTVKISQTLAIEAILRNPLQYVVHVLSNYYGMWESAFTYEGTMSGMTRQFYQINQSVADKSWFAGLAMARSLYHDPSIDALFQERQGDVAVADTMWREFTSHKEAIIIILFAASLIIF
jgi:hypothetical protein